MAEIFTYNSTNAISYIICILPALQDYCLFYYTKKKKEVFPDKQKQNFLLAKPSLKNY